MRFHNKTSTRVKPLPIRFNKIDGYIKFHNKVRYLVLFDDLMSGIIKYVIGSNIL